MSGYVIQVGNHAPAPVIISTPNKNGDPSPSAIEGYGQVGAYFLINRAIVWARRVLTDGKPLKDEKQEEQVLEVTDTKYKGKLEFLKWGEPKVGAQAIEIRYLDRSLSLDYDYQRNVQKIEVDPEGKDGSGIFELQAGENKFDYTTEALKIDYLKVHPQNRDSKSKNPDPRIKGYQFHEVTDNMVDQTGIKVAESKIEAGYFVKTVSTKPEQLKNLFDIFTERNVDFGLVNKLSNPNDIYKSLLVFADQKPSDFDYYVGDFKKKISDAFVKANSYKVLDLTKNGVIAFLDNNKPQIIYESVEGKGDAMLDWVMQNFLDAAVYERTKHLFSLCEKLN